MENVDNTSIISPEERATEKEADMTPLSDEQLPSAQESPTSLITTDVAETQIPCGDNTEPSYDTLQATPSNSSNSPQEIITDSPQEVITDTPPTVPDDVTITSECVSEPFVTPRSTVQPSDTPRTLSDESGKLEREELEFGEFDDRSVPRTSSSFDMIADEEIDNISDEDIEDINNRANDDAKPSSEIAVGSRQIDDLFKYKQQTMSTDDMCKWSTASTCSNDTIAQQRLFMNESAMVEVVDDRTDRETTDNGTDSKETAQEVPSTSPSHVVVASNGDVPRQESVLNVAFGSVSPVESAPTETESQTVPTSVTDELVSEVFERVEATSEEDVEVVPCSASKSDPAPVSITSPPSQILVSKTEVIVPQKLSEDSVPEESTPEIGVKVKASSAVSDTVQTSEQTPAVAVSARESSGDEPVKEACKLQTPVQDLVEVKKDEKHEVDSPKAVEFKTEEPKVEESKAEEPTAEEPKAEEPTVEESKAEEPKVEESKAEEPTAEEPKAEEPTADEPKAEESKAEEPTAKEPKAETLSDEWVDVLGSGALKKRTKKVGSGQNLERGQQVRMKYTLMLSSGKIVDDGLEQTFQLGDGEVIDAIDLTANLAKVGEVYEAMAQSRFAYGIQGRPPYIGPNSSVLMIVEIMQAEDTPKIPDMSEVERLKIGDRKRKIGNDHFARHDYARASTNYQSACKYLDPPSYEVSGEVSGEVKDIQSKTWCNLALSELKNGKHDAGILAADRALQIDPKSTKALYRKGKLLQEKGELEQAEKALKQALQIDPNSVGCKQFLKELTQKVSNQKKKQQQLYKKMLNLEESGEASKAPSFGETHTSWLEGAIPTIAGSVTVGALAVAAYYGIKSLQG